MITQLIFFMHFASRNRVQKPYFVPPCVSSVKMQTRLHQPTLCSQARRRTPALQQVYFILLFCKAHLQESFTSTLYKKACVCVSARMKPARPARLRANSLSSPSSPVSSVSMSPKSPMSTNSPMSSSSPTNNAGSKDNILPQKSVVCDIWVCVCICVCVWPFCFCIKSAREAHGRHFTRVASSMSPSSPIAPHSPIAPLSPASPNRSAPLNLVPSRCKIIVHLRFRDPWQYNSCPSYDRFCKLAIILSFKNRFKIHQRS